MMWGFGDAWGGWGFFWQMILMWLVPLGIIVFLIYLAFSWGKGKVTVNQDRMDPLAIIKQRYASGELNAEEYRRMKDELKGD
jgi:putative membrane protein